MLSGIVGELNDQEVLPLDTAADAVCPGDVGALRSRLLQDAQHLRVGLIGELDDGGRPFR